MNLRCSDNRQLYTEESVRLYQPRKKGISPSVWLALLSVVAFAFIGFLWSPRATRPVVTVGIATWPGYAPGFVGKAHKLFEGIDVNLKTIDDLTSRDAAFRSGQIDVLASTADMWVQEHAQGIDGKVILVTDESFGADGLLVNKQINSISQLRGKKIAFARATPSHYLLYKLLKLNGLTPEDIVQVKVEDPSNAAQAFSGGTVDGAVTWEPFITAVRKSGKGILLASTRQHPGYIVDVLVASPHLLKQQDVLDKFIRGWLKSVDFIGKHPQDSYADIARGFNIPVRDVAQMMTGLRLADDQMNRNYLSRTGNKSSKMSKVFHDAGQFWKRQGIVRSVPEETDLISFRFCELAGVRSETIRKNSFVSSGVTINKPFHLAASIIGLLAYFSLFWWVILRSHLTSALTFGFSKVNKSGFKRLRWLYAASPLLVISLWGIGSYSAILPARVIPPPMDVIKAFCGLIASGVLLRESAISFQRVIVGFVIASIVAVPTGLLAGAFLVGRQILTPINSFLRYIPPTAFVALLIVYCGVDEAFKYAVVFVGVVFFIVQMVIDVVEDLEVTYVEMAKTSGFTNQQIFKQIVIPACAPRIFDVLRINLSAAWTFLVVAELVGSEQGLGHFISISQRYLRLDDLFAGIVMFGIIGIFTDLLLQCAARYLYRWHHLSIKQ